MSTEVSKNVWKLKDDDTNIPILQKTAYLLIVDSLVAW